MSLIQRVHQHLILAKDAQKTIPPESHYTNEASKARLGPKISALVPELIAQVSKTNLALEAKAREAEAKKPFPPISLATVQALEKRLGFALPALLTDLLTQVSNGGFGPGYGILPVSNAYTEAMYHDIGWDEECLGVSYLMVQTEEFCSGSPFVWPDKLLPFCHWGCAIYSCLDCSQPQAPIVTFDPNLGGLQEDWGACFLPHRSSLADWLEAWLDKVDLWAEIRQSTLDRVAEVEGFQ